MEVLTRLIFVDDHREKFFGEGPCRLLRSIEKTGSLRSAAQSMGMAYSKAVHLMNHAEEVLGFALTERTIGGKTGGGSVLTSQGKEWLEKYEHYRDECERESRRLYEKYYGNAESSASSDQ